MQRALNKHQFRSIIYLIMAIGNIIISIPFATRYGIIGVTVGTTISVIFGNGIIMNVFYHKALKIDIIYFWKEILKTLKGFVFPVISGLYIMKYVVIDSIGDFISAGIIYSLIYCVSVFLFSCNTYEKKLIFDVFKNCRNNFII